MSVFKLSGEEFSIPFHGTKVQDETDYSQRRCHAQDIDPHISDSHGSAFPYKKLEAFICYGYHRTITQRIPEFFPNGFYLPSRA